MSNIFDKVQSTLNHWNHKSTQLRMGYIQLSTDSGSILRVQTIEILKVLTSGWVNINFESPLRRDNSVIVAVVQIHDMIAIRMI